MYRVGISYAWRVMAKGGVKSAFGLLMAPAINAPGMPIFGSRCCLRSVYALSAVGPGIMASRYALSPLSIFILRLSYICAASTCYAEARNLSPLYAISARASRGLAAARRVSARQASAYRARAVINHQWRAQNVIAGIISVY